MFAMKGRGNVTRGVALFRSMTIDLPYTDCHSKGSLCLLAITVQVRIDWSVTAPGQIPREL